MVCERWCVTKMVCKRGCVKDGGWQCGVWKMVRERWWVTKLGVKDGVWKMVCDKVVCERGCVKAGATPATQNDRGCAIVPRLPGEIKVDVTKCHGCHAKCRGVPGDQAGPSAPPSAICPTPATQNDGGCDIVPRLPRETKVDVRLCHACHAKCRGVPGDQAGPSAPPSAICPTPATQNDGGCDIVPRLPRKTTVDVSLCHACHAKCRGVPGDQAGPSAPPSAICPTPATQNDGGCDIVPRKVPRLPGRPSRTKRATQCHLSHACHAKRRWMWHCATPATWNEGGCEVVPCLPRKVPRRPGRPSRTKRATQCHLSHACHAKRRWMWHCATPATWNEGGCEVVPRLPRKVPRRPGRPSRTKRATQCHLSHACHAKRRWMWHCATPATQNDGGCKFVPRLPRETKVDVTKCHACVWTKCVWTKCV